MCLCFNKREAQREPAWYSVVLDCELVPLHIYIEI